MSWDCTVAFSKCIQHFQTGAAAIQGSIGAVSPDGNTTSCNLTMTVLNLMTCRGRSLSSHNLRNGGGVITGANAAGQMDTLVDGEELIFVSIIRDHHFTVFPLGDQVGLLQGFQGFYNLHTWITTSGKTQISKATFKQNFRNIFSANAGTRDAATSALFAIPGSEGDITGYFHSQLSPVTIVSASPNLFRNNAVKASLAAPSFG